MVSGSLRFKHTGIEAHGPAFMTLLRRRSEHTGEIMDISVDLCPAIRVSEHLESLLSPESVTCRSYHEWVQNTGSALLIPECKRGVSCNDGLCFKASFTETEVLLMANISEHHRNCYKLVRYLINGRPVPSMKSKSVFKELYLSQLMRLIWYLSHRRPAKAQASLRIRAVSPKPSLFAHMKYENKQRVRPNIRHLAPLDAAHARLKNEFTEDGMYHYLMSWLNNIFRSSMIIPRKFIRMPWKY